MPAPKLRLPPPNDHKVLLELHNCAWAYEVKTLLYHHNPGTVKSVRVRATFPKGCVGDWYPIRYLIEVLTDQPLDVVLTNAIQSYSQPTKLMVLGCAVPGVWPRPVLNPYRNGIQGGQVDKAQQKHIK